MMTKYQLLLFIRIIFKVTFVAACIILYFDTVGSFSTVKSVQYQFVVVSMLNKLSYRNALRFAIKRIVTAPVFNNALKEECC